MKSLNRGALLVRPREPYLKWVASLDGDTPLAAEALTGRVSVYLVSDPEALDEESPDVTPYFKEIFHEELAAWSLDEDQWPTQRDLKVFRGWFAVTAQSIVVDLGDDVIEVESDDDM